MASTLSETSQLLEHDGDVDPELTTTAAGVKKPATPLPWRPLGTLLILSIANPLALELIFPFINQVHCGENNLRRYLIFTGLLCL